MLKKEKIEIYKKIQSIVEVFPLEEPESDKFKKC